MLPLALALAASLPIRLLSAQEPPPKYGLPPEHTVMLMVTDSPLGGKEATGRQDPAVAVLEFAWVAVLHRLDERELEEYGVRLDRFSPMRGGGILCVLTVTCRNKPASEEEFKKVAALAEKRLEETLLVLHKASMESLYQRVRQAEQRLLEARDGEEKRRSELQTLRTKLIQADASPGDIDQQQNTLRQDRLKLRVELVGFKARREAIVRAVAEASDKLKAISDEQQRELGELAKIVDLREQQLARVKGLYKGNSASISEIQQAELEVARAKADLAERRRLIAQQAGSDQLSRLNQQLADVQIEMSGDEARVAGIEQMLNRLQSKEVLELLSQYGQATQQLEYARAEEKAAFEQLAEAKKTAESTPAPKVVEIRGPAAPK
jgi:chromosome segregation ATPase